MNVWLLSTLPSDLRDSPAFCLKWFGTMDPVAQLDVDVRRENKVMGHCDHFFSETSTARSSIEVALRLDAVRPR